MAVLKQQMGLVGVWRCAAEEKRDNEIEVNRLLILLKVNAADEDGPS